jgi:GNAT superfamily N-acetyltransferase
MPRPAMINDLEAIGVLYHSVWHETRAANMPVREQRRRALSFFLDRMRLLLPTVLVEDRAGSLAGFASWQGRMLMLGQLYIDRACRGTGIAVALLWASELAITSSGVTEAELRCLVGNHRAHRFYQRSGWIDRGEVVENLAGDLGEASIPFWRMTKPSEIPLPPEEATCEMPEVSVCAPFQIRGSDQLYYRDLSELQGTAEGDD